jgi:hypothetical protein
MTMGARLVFQYRWVCMEGFNWWVSYSVNSIWEGYATFPDADIFTAVQLPPV